MSLVDSKDLVGFANAPEGRYLLGELLRKLIASWIPLNRIGGISFHSGSANGLPKWDGWLRLRPDVSGLPHFSLWELSTQDADTSKIRLDFEKRASEVLPGNWTHETTTLVMVTLRRLSDRIGLEHELRNHAKNQWQDVQILDAPALQQWIELCPTVETWCAEFLNIGKGRLGKTLATFWREWSRGTKPPISTDLLLAGRDVDIFEAGDVPTAGTVRVLKADSPQEVAAYVYARLMRERADAEWPSVLDTAIVIEDVRSAKLYAELPLTPGSVPLTILLSPANEVANLFVGHCVICGIGNSEKAYSSIALGRALRSEFETALNVSMEMPPETASVEARACGSSVTVWAAWNRLEANGMGSLAPPWSNASVAHEVLPAIVCGGWQETPQDTAILERLSGLPYVEFQRDMLKQVTIDYPLLEKASELFSVVAPVFAFAIHAPMMEKALLVALCDIAVQLFGSVSENDRHLFASDENGAGMHMAGEYSELLRQGVASTLLWTSVFHERLDHSGACNFWGGAQQYVDHVLAKVFASPDFPLLTYSIGDQLRVLAEAVPNEFLSAVEHSIELSPEQWQTLQHDHGHFAQPLHAPVLFSLEALAWSADYFERVVGILVRLAVLDPGGKSGNRPANCLREIFLAWKPGTSVSIDARIELLKNLVEEYPTQAWELLLRLLRRSHDSSSPTVEPLVKDFGRSKMKALTSTQTNLAFTLYTDLAIEVAGHTLQKLLNLLDSLSKFGSSQKARFVSALVIATESVPQENSFATWDKLRKFIVHNRNYAGTFWALPEADLTMLDPIELNLRPVDVVQNNVWLFETGIPEFDGAPEDVTSHQQMCDKFRESAIQNIRNIKGVRGVVRLLHEPVSTYLVSQAIAAAWGHCEDTMEYLDICLSEGNAQSRETVSLVSATLHFQFGEAWTTDLLAKAEKCKWGPIQLTECLIRYPDDLETFRLVESFGQTAVDYFWRQRNVYLRRAAGKTSTYAIRKIIKHGRASEAIQAGVSRLPARLAVDLVSAAVDELVALQALPPGANMLAYHFDRAISSLMDRKGIPIERLATLEYKVFPLLRYNDSQNKQRAMHRILARSPQLFVKLVSQVSWPEGNDFVKPERVDTEIRERANIARQIFETWETVPGWDSNGGLNSEIFMGWAAEARTLAKYAEREASVDVAIGRILSRAPLSPSETSWPSHQIASILQHLQSDSVDAGVLDVILNDGVTTRGFLDGGEQEHSVARFWSARSAALPAGFSRAKRLCEQVATHYRQIALAFDHDALRTRLSLSK